MAALSSDDPEPPSPDQNPSMSWYYRFQKVPALCAHPAAAQPIPGQAGLAYRIPPNRNTL
jgi:hypothetical protein